MAKLSTDDLLDAFKEMTLIELSEFVKQFEEVFEGRAITADEVNKIADLESREVLLAKLAGAMKGNLTKAAGLFQAPLSQVARLAAALQEKRESAEGSPAAPAADDAPTGDAAAADTDTPTDTAAAETASTEDAAPASDA